MWGAWFRDKEFARLGIGPFINELLEAMEKRMKDESSHQVLVYTGKSEGLDTKVINSRWTERALIVFHPFPPQDMIQP